MRSAGTVLIPAAGESRRFTEAGFEGHKAALRIRLGDETKTMLRHVIDEIPVNYRIVIVCQTSQFDQLSRAADQATQEIEFVCLDYPTLGQSDTLFQGMSAVRDMHKQIVVQNCDVQVSNHTWQWATAMPHIASILLHHDKRPRSEPPLYSYVNNMHFPTAWAEKQRISDYAQTGLWSFPTAASLLSILGRQLQEPAGTELYLSGALPHYREKFAGRLATSGEYRDLGTPDMVRASGGEICR